MIIFLYGSLKKGYWNHERFGVDKFTPLGDHEVEGFELYNLGHYPGMVSGGSDEDKVKGELYEVPDDSKEFTRISEMERGANFRLTSVAYLKKAPIYAFLYRGDDCYDKIKEGEWRG